jgi:hypothetical protein
VGAVIGNAIFKNYIVIYQNCVIGSNEQGEYPEFREPHLKISNIDFR